MTFEQEYQKFKALTNKEQLAAMQKLGRSQSGKWRTNWELAQYIIKRQVDEANEEKRNDKAK